RFIFRADTQLKNKPVYLPHDGLLLFDYQFELKTYHHLHDDTFLVQIGNRREEAHRAVSTPVYFSTAYRHEQLGAQNGYDYTRTGNPTRDVLENAVKDLERGDRAFATSSGMAAVQLVFSLFEKGAHFIASRDIY